MPFGDRQKTAPISAPCRPSHFALRPQFPRSAAYRGRQSRQSRESVNPATTKFPWHPPGLCDTIQSFFSFHFFRRAERRTHRATNLFGRYHVSRIPAAARHGQFSSELHSIPPTLHPHRRPRSEERRVG